MPEVARSLLEAEALAEDGDGIIDALVLRLTVRDPETLAALRAHREGTERDAFALAALRVGVLALGQARGELDARKISQECDRLLGSLEKHLAEHASTLNERLVRVLGEYFDPQTGRLPERIQSLVGRDGQLEQVLRRHIGSQDSELCRTLVAHVGRESPLMQLLSPNESEGLLAQLNDVLAGQLDSQREVVLKQFSLDNKEGALARLLAELSENHGRLEEKLQGQIDALCREFSLDEDNSALKRLVQYVTASQDSIARQVSLDNEQSAMSRLKKVLELHQESNQRFQEEVKATLAAMAAKRAEADRSTRHGVEFEAAVIEFLQREAQRGGDVFQPTGNTTGLIRNCKKGDAVVSLGPDSAAAGATIVVEAKEKESYDVKAALAEIDEARRNRGAQVGLFIYSRKTAPAGLDCLVRYGSDIVTVWDAEDAATDVVLRAALALARALCVRAAQQREAQSADFTAIDRAILEINRRADELDKINGWSDTIRSNSDKITELVRKARKSLEQQVLTLQEHVADLKTRLSLADSPERAGPAG